MQHCSQLVEGLPSEIVGLDTLVVLVSVLIALILGFGVIAAVYEIYL